MFMGAVYLFHYNSNNRLKQKILQSFLVIMVFGSIENVLGQNSDNRISRSTKWIKRTILKNLNFLPYVEYKPSTKPSPTGEILLSELNIYEKIIDDHVQFENEINKELQKERGKRIDEIYDIIRLRRRIGRKRKRKDPIEEKISDINYIRGLTQRYESWSPEWGKKTDLAKENLSIDEIDLVQYEIRRISKKHRHIPFKQKI